MIIKTEFYARNYKDDHCLFNLITGKRFGMNATKGDKRGETKTWSHAVAKIMHQTMVILLAFEMF